MGCTGAEMAGVAPSAFGGYVRTRLRLPKAQAGKTRNEAKTVNKPRDLFIIRFPFKDASDTRRFAHDGGRETQIKEPAYSGRGPSATRLALNAAATLETLLRTAY